MWGGGGDGGVMWIILIQTLGSCGEGGDSKVIHGSLLDHFAQLYDYTSNYMHMLLCTCGSFLCALPKL